jgi:hypothetical protein
MNDGSDRHGNHPGSGHHGPHDQEGHHHGHHHDHHDGHHHGGPEGTEFLDLEMSKVIHGEAGSLAREAARSILRSAIEARLRERLGDKLEALGRLAADDLVADLEANLAIEATIASRREARSSADARVRDIMHAPAAPAPGAGRSPRNRERR